MSKKKDPFETIFLADSDDAARQGKQHFLCGLTELQASPR